MHTTLNNYTIVRDSEEAWQSSHDAAQRAVSRGDQKLAEVLYLRAIERAQVFQKQDHRLHTSMINLAQLYNAIGRSGDAERLFEHSRQLWRNAEAQSRAQIDWR